MTSRSYVWTSFQIDLKVELKDARYCIWQKEKCPDTGRLHLQGYTEFKNAIRITGAKKWLGDQSAHFETRKGTREQAQEYCKKTESRVEGPWELGEWIKGQGARSDLAEIKEMVKAGATDRDIAEEHPSSFIRYTRGIKALREAYLEEWSQQYRDIKVEILWGPAGSGKTRYAYDTYGIANVYKKTQPAKELWWDGYSGQDVLLIDDFYGWISKNEMLAVMDIYPLQLPVKGSFTWAAWHTIIITSNSEPKTWYHDGLGEAFERRISKIRHVTK